MERVEHGGTARKQSSKSKITHQNGYSCRFYWKAVIQNLFRTSGGLGKTAIPMLLRWVESSRSFISCGASRRSWCWSSPNAYPTLNAWVAKSLWGILVYDARSEKSIGLGFEFWALAACFMVDLWGRVWKVLFASWPKLFRLSFSNLALIPKNQFFQAPHLGHFPNGSKRRGGWNPFWWLSIFACAVCILLGHGFHAACCQGGRVRADESRG